jgi:transcriptional regulator with XRE-family HTH domain
MDVKALFGAKLKHYRKQADLSQEQLAEKVDVSVKHLSAVERGLTFVSADLLCQLASTLRVPLAAFFCTDTEKVINNNFLTIVNQIVEKNFLSTLKMIQNDIQQNDGLNNTML